MLDKLEAEIFKSIVSIIGLPDVEYVADSLPGTQITFLSSPSTNSLQ